jgi:hypothetical protein
VIQRVRAGAWALLGLALGVGEARAQGQDEARVGVWPRAGVDERALFSGLPAGARVVDCYGLPRPALRALQDEAQRRSGRTTPDLARCREVVLKGPLAAAATSVEAALRADPRVEEAQRATPLHRAQMPLPGFADEQTYLREEAAFGLSIAEFWGRFGRFGEGRTIVDVEGDFDTLHREVASRESALGGPGIGTSLDTSIESTNHGTASLGMVCAPHDGQGIDGIAPAAQAYLFPSFTFEYPWGVGPAIARSLQRLSPGDVIFLEQQREGPEYDVNADPSGQFGMVPVEFYRVDFDAIVLAVNLGITVVEPAGNGFQDLDDALYEGRFDRQVRDSGAIVVCAGAPPSGNYGPPASPMYFTNFGSRCDAQAHGAETVTLGYGDLFDAGDGHTLYTAQFAGTSSATPQVAGVVVLLQSLALQLGGYMPARSMRALLLETSAVRDPNIGPLPNAARAGRALEGRVQQVPAPQVPGRWMRCEGACDGRLSCRAFRPGESYCVAPCEVFQRGANEACGEDQGCVLQPVGDGVCAEVIGDAPAGSPCVDSVTCGANLFCSADTGRCERLCSRSRNLGCGAGERCGDAGGNEFGDLGLCELDVEPPPPPECVDDTDCPPETRCARGACVPDDEPPPPPPPPTDLPPGTCRQDTDCPRAQRCENGLCVPAPPPPCPRHTLRRGGECVPDGTCTVQADCAAPYSCNGTRCVRGAAPIETDGGLAPADVAFTDALVTDGGADAAPADGAPADGALEVSEQRALVQGGRGCGCGIGADPRGFGPLGGLGLGLWLVLRRRGRRAHSPSKAYS